MKADIANRHDIELLLEQFYQRVLQDEVIGYLFTEVAQLDLAHHLPLIADFWESILLDTGRYARNAMEPHLLLHRKSSLLPAHFERWLQLFSETLDAHFAGEKTTEAKKRAQAIAALMQLQIQRLDKSTNAGSFSSA